MVSSGHDGSFNLGMLHLIHQAVHCVHEKFQQQQQPLIDEPQAPSSAGCHPPCVMIANSAMLKIPVLDSI